MSAIARRRLSPRIRAWLGGEWLVGRARLRDRRRLVAMILMGLAGGLVTTFLLARGELAGSDARAYWAGVRIWLDGGNPFSPPAPFLPFVYAPWTLTLFAPWALLPWDVAWFAWRGLNILLLIWSAHWAYQRRPLATGILLAFLAAPIAATLDTGNITFLLAMMIWGAYFVGPRMAGVLWALSTSLKWFPLLFLLILPPRARLWGVGALALSGILLLATWPQSLIHLDLALNLPRPFRIDLVLLIWGAVPWLWAQAWFWERDRGLLIGRWADGRSRAATARHDWRAWHSSGQAGAQARQGVEDRVRSFFGV
jgi:hypothetical protein